MALKKKVAPEENGLLIRILKSSFRHFSNYIFECSVSVRNVEDFSSI